MNSGSKNGGGKWNEKYFLQKDAPFLKTNNNVHLFLNLNSVTKK